MSETDQIKKFIPVITRKETCKVNLQEILYIEKELRRINIYTYNRVYTIYGKFSDIIDYLGDQFYKCHGSCIVNLDKVIRMEDGIIYLENGYTIRMGQNNYQFARRQYHKFLLNHYRGFLFI